MRVAIFLDCLEDNGGAFQQSLSTIQLLTKPGATKHTFVVFTPFEPTHRLLARHGIASVLYRQAGVRHLDKWSATLLGGAILARLRRLGFRRLGRHLDALLDDYDIDLAVLNDTSDVALRIGNHPFIITVHDLDHRDHPEFPEFYSDRLFERNERFNSGTLTRALAVITNTPYLSNRVSQLYQVDPKRIVELPFVPSYAVRQRAAGGKTADTSIRQKYELPAQFVFYPAYFLPHKNHLYLLEGLADLERRHGLELHAVFCGRDPVGHQETVERQADKLGLKGRVRFLGFVPDTDIAALYECAFSTVVPSYFGPTNLQPVEAVSLGCPVICSDHVGCREQLGDAALYCDLSDPSNLANLLASLAQDLVLRGRLREAGQTLTRSLADMDYGGRLSAVLDNFAYTRRRWAWPGQ